jgi:hypothetical protein
VDPQKLKDGKVRAFYAVPLYKSIYERFDGRPLPPAAALERVIVELGVSQKQATTARQVFQRSAKQAGFFEHGINRLVEPVTGKRPADEGQDEGADDSRDEANRNGGGET